MNSTSKTDLANSETAFCSGWKHFMDQFFVCIDKMCCEQVHISWFLSFSYFVGSFSTTSSSTVWLRRGNKNATPNLDCFGYSWAVDHVYTWSKIIQNHHLCLQDMTQLLEIWYNQFLLLLLWNVPGGWWSQRQHWNCLFFVTMIFLIMYKQLLSRCLSDKNCQSYKFDELEPENCNLIFVNSSGIEHITAEANQIYTFVESEVVEDIHWHLKQTNKVIICPTSESWLFSFTWAPNQFWTSNQLNFPFLDWAGVGVPIMYFPFETEDGMSLENGAVLTLSGKVC